MSKNLFKGVVLMIGVMMLYGCAGAKKVEVRRYVDIKDRVDQKMEDGNAGYLFGTPQPEDRSEFRKTRKIYVVEFSKEAEEGDVKGEADTSASVDEEPVMEEPVYKPERMTMDDDGEDLSDDNRITITEDDYRIPEESKAPMPVTTGSYTEYTVQKNDTLQKISKKFYGSYSKWSRIYEANRDVIDNPDKIKAGTILRIPQ